MITEKIILEFCERVIQKYNPQKIVLFGSYAAGSPNTESDVDVLVILPFDGKNAMKAAEILIQTDPHFPIDLLVRKPDEVDVRIKMGDFFMQDIINNGKVLYEASHSRVG